MFKLESYITPILLSYVDRYIKNFRLEDSQVSLWGGDASFHNLDLRLEVLEQELQLPFSFVSGHIRELLIHVPWTKLASEPITITINTIECILKLRGSDPAATPDTSVQAREKLKKTVGHRQEIEAPPSYVQLLVNKIVSNIRIYCNNLILKYVEEDIVLSMNVKLLKFESANEKWEPAYTDLSPSQVILRKIIAVNDLTLCLDKRNAAGKIDVYQEPMLYRCSMTMHLLRHYHSATASRASTTRLDIYCNNMEFGMTEQQVPMLMRLIMLLYALQQKQLKPETEIPTDSSNIPSELRENLDESETWTGWAWSYVSSVLPAPWDEEWNNEQLKNHSGHTVHLGFYVDNLSITFKVSESSGDRGYYSQKKLRYWPMLILQLQGIYCETIMHGLKWFNSSFGISQAMLLPIGLCSCSHDEIVEGAQPVPYLKLGSAVSHHKNDSLFDVEAVENKGEQRQYNTSWDYHMTANSKSVLLERTPAVAFDYVYQMELPNDMTSEMLSEIGSDYEFSNLSEMSSMRLCFGPFKLRLCSGFFHRIDSLKVAASHYDYPPYSVPKPDLPLNELLPPSEEDFDALCEFISSRSMSIIFYAPIIELQLMDHPYFTASKGNLFRKRKKLSTNGGPQSMQRTDLPKITIECQFLNIDLQYPMYVNRLVHTTCQLPDPPAQLFNACFSQQNIKIIGLRSRLVLNSSRHTTILTPCSMSYSCKSILKPQYWINPDIPHVEVTFESESVTINGTKAKMMVVAHIVEKIIRLEPDTVMNSIHGSTLLIDAAKDYGLPYLEVCIEGVRFKKVTTNSTVSIDLSLGSIKAFIFEPVEVKLLSKTTDFGTSFASRDIQQVLFVSGPELTKVEKDKRPKGLERSFDEPPLFTATLQYPLNPDVQTHPTILIFNLQEVRICIDPLLCRWLLYSPKSLNIKNDFDLVYHRNKNISEASGSAAETPRRLSSQIESVHSSSDREPLYILQRVQKCSKEDSVDMQEKIYNVLKTWFDVWKGMLLCGDIQQCTIYFPMTSLSAVGSQGIQEAVEQAIHKDTPPDIMVITLPFANVRSAQRQNITKYLKTLPVKLSESIWSTDKSSFPWTMSISELSCYTIQQGHKLIFLKPVSLSATVGLSTRPTKCDLKDSNTDLPSTSSPNNSKTDIGYLGVCVHIDMSPVQISTSEVQVYLFASILYGIMEVASNLLPEKPKVAAPKSPDVVAPMLTRGSSTLSPTVLRENTLDTVSEKTPPMSNVTAENVDTDSVKLTAWVQWTITRFTIELLSSEYKDSMGVDDQMSEQPKLKLVIDAEDIVSSLDFQSVYLKIKSKVGSVSIQHYKRKSSNLKWQPGPFSGVVMRLREDITGGQRHEDNGFIGVTITRASCKHTHTLWGAVQKRHKDKKLDNTAQLLSPTRYITEIVVNVQPIDFIISLKTLKSFYVVMLPLMEIPLPEGKVKEEQNMLSYINNQVLPLAYLDCQDIRLIVPSVELTGTGALHDVCIFQVQKVCLAPTAVNPICRTPIRPDIYEQAAHARILNIPGSEVEDRQYQFDVIGMSISTGTWDDIDTVFSPTGSVVSNLRGMSENPALEWNNLEQGQPNMTPIMNLWQVTEKFDISIVAAPAMIYKDNTLICGNSMEVNFVTDIQINVSLHQIKLTSALFNEFVMLFEPFDFEEGISTRSKIKFPYTRFEWTHDIDEDNDSIFTDILRDSGIDTSDIRSVLSSKVQGAASTFKTVTESEKHYNVFPRPPNPLPQTSSVVPIEILLTGGGIFLSLYQVDTTKPNYAKHRKRRKSAKKADDEQGYDASEESVEEKNDSFNHYVPLLYVAVVQPNAFFSKHSLGKRMQISCFDVNLKLSGPEYSPVNHVPTEQDFPVKLLETRSGVPHTSTGILPAFFTMRFSRGIGKTGNLELEVSKPTKILCCTSKWMHLFTVKDKLLDCFKTCSKTNVSIFSGSTRTGASDVPQSLAVYSRTSKYSDTTYTKFQEIKEYLHGTNAVSVKFDQVIFAIESDNGHELHLGVEKFKSTLTVLSRPEKLCNVCTLECITLTVTNESFRRLLLNPWTVSFDVCLFWESWQSTNSDPQIQITAESDCIMLDISPEQINCIDIVARDLKEFIATIPFGREVATSVEPTKIKLSCDKDQHYKDDLRAGAFQFVDANTNNADELPLPYQVMFWNKNISAMAWRYPQPRALTKVRVFPVPYKMTLGTQDDLMVLCHLEYWSECRNCYLPFTQFYLSESEVCHLALPEGSPQPIVASTWRVVITMINEKEDSNLPNVSISPRALAACMRIDSYFNKSLIPNITAGMYITKIDVSLYSYINKTSQVMRMPECLKHFSPDMLFPESQCFLTLTWDNMTVHCSTWNFKMFSAELCSSIKCSVLDYAFLTTQPLIEPFTSKLEIIASNSLACNFISKPVHLMFGPSIAHTLAVSGQLWSQNLNTADSEQDFIIMTRYVVCNDTNVNIRFGQSVTEEDILLPPKYFHMYSWRSQKRKQQLKVALEENEWIWSKSFSIHNDGIQTIQLSSEKNLTMLISVKSLSVTQKQVTISGQLIVSNMLLEHFELKVVEAVNENKEIAFRAATTYIMGGKTSTPSIFINNKKKYYLRLRFYGLESAWTGDIPLREHANGSQPWLVKVPLQERGQFLSVWCRIVIQDFQKVKRILAMLWPLFTVRSNLPISANVQIETPTLNVHLDSIVEGKGKIQQLYCPGTIDHSHQLSFELENGTASSNPYVPLNYSLVDQQKFFKRLEKEDIDDILKVLGSYSGETKWPYFGDELDAIDWIVDEQPLTHVQVRYQNACQYSSSLLVELLPWSLMVNTLGAPVAVMFNGVELCRIQHHGIVAPPKLEANFNIAICSGDELCCSGPLQLAKSDWSQAFYMPKITGTIPLEGNIKTAILCESHICMVSLTSALSNEIRLLKVSSTHVLSNHMAMQMQVICLAVPDADTVYDMPNNIEPFCFTLPPHLHKSNSGIPIIKWLNLDNSSDSNTDFALYVSFSIKPELGWSCPIRVDKTFLRRSFSVMSDDKSIPVVLAAQEHKGQIYLSIHNDPRPQIYVENNSKITVFCAQMLGDDKGVAIESQHFLWHCQINGLSSAYYTMPMLSDKFPELPHSNFSETVVLASDPEGDISDLQWSVGVSVTSDNEQFVRIPYYGDIKLCIVNTACTTFLSIESVSQVEISARDIRVRLSMHEMESTPSISSLVYSPSEYLHRSNTASKSSSASSFRPLDDAVRSQSDGALSKTTKQSHSIFQRLPTVAEQYNVNMLAMPFDVHRRRSDPTASMEVTTKSLLVPTMSVGGRWSNIKILAFVKSFAATFTLDCEQGGDERCELANFTCDNIALTAEQKECLSVKFSASDIQFDNQLYSRESYDFPVVLIGQEGKPLRKLNSLNTPVEDLIRNAYVDALVTFELTFDTLRDAVQGKNITGAKNVRITINSISCFIEDVYLTRLLDYLNNFIPTKLVVWPLHKKVIVSGVSSGSVVVPELVSWQCVLLARPLTVRSITVNAVALLLSVHCSVKLYIALDQSPLQFGKFERKRLLTTPYRLGHAMTMHYLSGAIFGAGWVVSSLELLGSPGGLARAMGTGLRDFVSLPYRGLVQGPMAFLKGITHGSASLMRHVTAGTLQSVTKLASSVARNLDRLTLDEEHLKRTEEQRRQKPQGLAQGFMQGLTGLGISLLGAVGGIAHHPLQSVMSDGASPRSLAAGVGLGLVGVFTKPLSGAAELVALTGQGLLQGAGWNSLPEPRTSPVLYHMYSGCNSVLKYNWKLMNSLSHTNLLYVTEATCISNTAQYDAVALILTLDALIIINTDEDQTQRIVTLSELSVVHSIDPTLLSFKLTPPLVPTKTEDEIVEMDPACRARVADYVRSTVGLLNLPDTVSPDHSDISISPLSSPGTSTEAVQESTVLSYYVNPQSRNYFLCLLALAKQQRHNYNFPVL